MTRGKDCGLPLMGYIMPLTSIPPLSLQACISSDRPPHSFVRQSLVFNFVTRLKNYLRGLDLTGHKYAFLHIHYLFAGLGRFKLRSCSKRESYLHSLW